jgi:hypothetical protein
VSSSETSVCGLSKSELNKHGIMELATPVLQQNLEQLLKK